VSSVASRRPHHHHHTTAKEPDGLKACLAIRTPGILRRQCPTGENLFRVKKIDVAVH